MMKLIFMIFFQFENNPRHPSLSDESKAHPGKAQQQRKCSSYIRFIQYIGLIVDWPSINQKNHYIFVSLTLQNQFSNSTSAAVIEANNKNKLKSTRGTTGGSVSPTHKLESNVVLQDVLSIKSYLHKLSRILQVSITELFPFVV